jgi:hypothetical protein
MRMSRAVLVAFLAVVVWPSAAVAETFCVKDSACVGDSSHTTVKGALDAAAANGSGLDRIQIGAGTFSEAGLADAPSNPVAIDGAGQGVTILTRPPATGAVVLRLENAQSVVGDLTASIPVGPGTMLGMILSGGSRAEHVRVDGGSTAAGALGVVVGGGSVLSRSTVSLPSALSSGNTGVSTNEGGVIDHCDIVATVGADMLGQGTVVRGAHITAVTGVFFDGGSAMTVPGNVDNTQVTSIAGAPDDAALRLRVSGGIVTLNVRHVTLIGPGSGVALRVESVNNTPAPQADIDVSDSIIHGYATDARAESGTVSHSTITLGATALDFSKVATSGAFASVGPLPGTNLDLNGVDPRLLSVAGDMRPAFDSPLVDRGVQGGLLAGESGVDLAGLPRLVDGDGEGTARRDIGAFEYQRSPPQLQASAAPTTAAVGAAITFSASATDADPFETPGPVSWSFDDGVTAGGGTVQHAFSTPGTHTATATAVDPAGVAGFATVSVTIPPPKDGEAPALAIAAKRVTLTRTGVAAIAVSCPAGETSGPCDGKLTLTSDKKLRLKVAARRKAKKVNLGSAAFSIPAGKTVKVKVKLTRRNRRLVARLKRLSVLGAATVHDQAGNSGKASAHFHLLAPAKKKKR